MTAQSLLHDLTGRGVILAASGDRLDVDAPDSALTDELIEELRNRKIELLELLQAQPADENPEVHDSALVHEADARELIAELHVVGCQFWTVEGQPRLYYPPGMEAGLVRRVATLIAGRDEASKTFRRLVRVEAA
jgi:tubulysin polyketide synthase-like protein